MKGIRNEYDAVIIGGGFFGLYLADCLSRDHRFKVLVIEKENQLMRRASYNNQARIHNGYHYPRSILTAKRSRNLFKKFCHDFKEAVVSDFEKYYAIGRHLGKINAQQFINFCKRIEAPCEEASSHIEKLFDPLFIEKTFKVTEFAFNSEILLKLIYERVLNNQVQILTNHQAIQVSALDKNLVTLVQSATDQIEFVSPHVFNCTYSLLNCINKKSKIEIIPLKHEITEMALVNPPAELIKKAFTIMCGPFFSLMPFPPNDLYTLSHVRYTPHTEWFDKSEHDFMNPEEKFYSFSKKSYFAFMIQDAKRYLPLLNKATYEGSIWEIKTVLPSSENDDGRPILFKPNFHFKGYHCIIGGKIDNVYDMEVALKKVI